MDNKIHYLGAITSAALLLTGCADARTAEYFDENPEERAEVIDACKNDGRLNALGQSADPECTAAQNSAVDERRQRMREDAQRGLEAVLN